MSKQLITLFATIMLAPLLFIACGDDDGDDTSDPTATLAATVSADSPYPLTITRSDGKTHTIEQAPQRVVSLSPGGTEIVYAIGAGDALAAGLIHGLLDGDLKRGVDYGAAMGALKHTIPGDLAWVTKEEVGAVLQGQGLRVRR